MTDGEEKITVLGSLLSELGMMKATYTPEKNFNLHFPSLSAPSLYEQYLRMNHYVVGKPMSQREKERLLRRFNAKNSAAGKLEIADDGSFEATLKFDGEHGSKEFLYSGAKDDLSALPGWIARCIYEYCQLETTPAQDEYLNSSEFQYPSELDQLLDLETGHREGKVDTRGWKSFITRNPDSVYALYRYYLIPKSGEDDSLQHIEAAPARLRDHELLRFLEADWYDRNREYERSVPLFVELLKSDRRNYAIYSDLSKGLRKLEMGEDAISILEHYAEQSPNSYLPSLAKADFYINYAWQARGSGYANTVSREAWAKCYERLEIAEKALLSAYELNPTDPRAPSELIITTRSLSNEREEVEKWFQTAIAIDPRYYRPYTNKLNYLMPKWYGSKEEMFAFARQCSEIAPEESRVGLIVLGAHEEMYWRSGDTDKEERKKYYPQPDVWKEMEATYKNFLEKHPDSRWDRNFLAKHACNALDYEEARRQFEIIGDDFEEEVWGSKKNFKRNKTVAYSDGKEPPEEKSSNVSRDRETRQKSNENRRVSLKAPFTGWNPNKRDPKDRIAVIHAVGAICRQAGMPLDFEKSYDNIHSSCDQMISPNIVKKPWKEAMESMLDPLGLSYTSENGKVALTKM
jgi:hypothetical protein